MRSLGWWLGLLETLGLVGVPAPAHAQAVGLSSRSTRTRPHINEPAALAASLSHQMPVGTLWLCGKAFTRMALNMGSSVSATTVAACR